MTDESTSGDGPVASAPPNPPEPERADPPRSRFDPMSVPATAPVWTYQHSFEPSAAELDPTGASGGSIDSVAIDQDASRGRRRGPALGVVALLLAVLAAGVEIGGIGVSTAGDYAAGTVLAIVAIAASVTAVVVGIIAAILRAGRAVGIIAVVLGVLVNPLVLVTVLGAVAGAASID